MASPEDDRGVKTPPVEDVSVPSAPEPSSEVKPDGSGEEAPVRTSEEYSPTVDASYGYYDDPYSRTETGTALATVEQASPPAPVAAAGGGGSLPPPPSTTDEKDDGDDDGMLRMSFLEHLEELRKRLFLMLAGVGVAFILSLTFSNQLWLFVQRPAEAALQSIGAREAKLWQTAPMEAFNIVWMKLPILVSVFLASPWILYQVWAFIAPGLYKRERRWAAPFVICSAGLFVLGGMFAYFVAFRFGLTFLLGIGRDINIAPIITISEYFDLFVNVILGVGLVFELPVLIFFLTLLRVTSPKFLLTHSRYAILVIVIIAAIVTPTPDVFNLMLFATPMVLLFFVGIFASYLLVLQREDRTLPWSKILYGVSIVVLVLAGLLYLAVTKYGYHAMRHWPFLTR